jgi:acetyl esterase/lipase
MKRRTIRAALLGLPVVLCGQVFSAGARAPQPAAGPQAAATRPDPALPPPTLANVPYGRHERQVLDFYQVKSDRPTPLLFFIHGGGWTAGDKGSVGEMARVLDAGISIVSINYRYLWQAQLAGIKPPVSWPLHDAARALQFVRTKAAEWNIDKQRIGASGGSAGACSSLWLAFHEDMGDAYSSDPIARESTRLWCAAVRGAQTSLDPVQLREWTPNSRYGGHAFGFMDPNDIKSRDTRFAEFFAARESVLGWIKEYSPIEHVTSDDPAVYLIYTDPPALGEPQKDPTHTANYGVKLQEKCRSAGVECELVYAGAPDVKHEQAYLYLIDKLKAPKE